MEEMKAKLKDMIIAELHLEDLTSGNIDDDAPLFGEGLGLDSLDALQLAVAVEEHFGVRIKDETEGRSAFSSVTALATFIAKGQGNQSSTVN